MFVLNAPSVSLTRPKGRDLSLLSDFLSSPGAGFEEVRLVGPILDQYHPETLSAGLLRLADTIHACRNVRRLCVDVAGCRDSISSLVRRVLQRNPALRELWLTGPADEQRYDLVPAFETCGRTLRVLGLTGCGLGEAAGRQLAELLGKSGAKIEVLDVSFNGLDAGAVSALMDVTLDRGGLRELNLSSDEVDEDIVHHICQHAMLTKLALRWCGVTNVMAAEIFRSPMMKDSLRVLNFAGSYSIDADSGRALADALKYTRTLEELDIECSGIPGDCSVVISEAGLSHNRSLVALGLCDNRDIDSSSILTALSRSRAPLRLLNLSKSSVSDSTAPALADLLARAEDLRELDLRRNTLRKQ